MVIRSMKKNLIFLMCFAFLSVASIGLVGCGGGGDSSDSSAPPPSAEPDINVSKTQIAFGDVVLNSYSEETISIENIGSSNLIIGQIAQANPLVTAFSIPSDTDNCSGTQLPPYQRCNLKIRFSPISQGPITDAFDIPSNDPADNSVTVSVSGYGRSLNVSVNEFYKDSCPTGKLLVTITDKDGNPQAGLPKDSFSLLENGVVKNVETVSPVTSPISAALVIDSSWSMDSFKTDVIAAAQSFIDDLAVNDEAAVIKFNGTYAVTQTFTTNKDDLKTAIATDYVGTDGSPLYDAIWLAIEETAKSPNRHAVVVITDGLDNFSLKTIEDVIAFAQLKGVPLFTIGLGSAAEDILLKMATESGGRYFLAPDSTALTAIYQQVAEILAGQYIIEYSSSSSGGATVLIDLEVKWNNLEGIVSKALPGC